jgi:hypothetical protein
MPAYGRIPGNGVEWRTFAVVSLTAAFLLMTGRHTLAQTQDSPGYFGPIRFQRQVFTNIRPPSIRIPNQQFSPIPRQSFPSVQFNRNPIVIPQINQAPIPRATFSYSNSIFGPIDGAKAAGAVPQTVPPVPDFRQPYRSRTIRPLSR